MQISDCPICTQLKEYEYSFSKSDDLNALPGPAYQLKRIKELVPEWNGSHWLEQCPHCGTYYTYKTVYEYLVSGSEDEEMLTRLTEAEAGQFLR